MDSASGTPCSRRLRTCASVRVRLAGQSDAIPHVDAVVVDGDVEIARLDHLAERDVDGGLRIQGPGPQRNGSRMGRGQGGVVHQVALVVVGGGHVDQVGLSHRRDAETAADRAAQGQVVRDPPPDGHLAVHGLVEVLVILEADGRTDGRVLSQIRLHIRIGGVAAPIGLAHEVGIEARKSVRADAELVPVDQRRGRVPAVVVPGVLLPGIDFVILRPVLEAEGEVQGIVRSQSELPREIQVDGMVRLRVSARLVARGNVLSQVDELGIHRVPDGELRAVTSDHAAQVVEPAVLQLAPDPGTDSQVGGHSAELRREAAGEQIDPGIEEGAVAQFGHGRKEPSSLGSAVPEPLFHIALRDIGKDVEMRTVAEVESHVAEEFEFVIHLRNAPVLRRHGNALAPQDEVLPGQSAVDLGLGQLGVGIGSQLVGPVDVPLGIAPLHAAAGRVHSGVLEAQVGEAPVGQGHSDVGRHRVGVAVAFVELAPAGLHFSSVSGVPEDEIHHAGHRVGAVLGGGAVAQHFHPLDRDRGDGGEIRTVRSVGHAGTEDIDDRSAMAALAVDQHQGGIAGQSAQIGRADERGTAADGLGVDVVGGQHDREHRVDVQVRLAGEGLLVDDVDGNGRVGDRPVLAARAHDGEFLDFHVEDGVSGPIRGVAGFRLVLGRNARNGHG